LESLTFQDYIILYSPTSGTNSELNMILSNILYYIYITIHLNLIQA